MGATVFFQTAGGNDIATLQMMFNNSSGVPTDPTVVTCVITDPTGTATIHTFGGASPADITKLSAGKFQLELGCTITGLWGYEWNGTGSASDVQSGTWTVNPSSIINQFYTSVEEIKSRLGITDTLSDFELQVAVQAAARAVEQYCGRHFYRVAETRTFVPYDIYELFIPDLVTLTSMACDTSGNGVFDQPWTQNVDFELGYGMWEYNANETGEPRPYNNIRAINAVGGGKFFPYTWSFSKLDRIQIVGVWGWPQVPFAVKMATQQLAAELFKLKDAPFGIAGTSEFGMMRIPRGGNPYVANLLCNYVNPRRSVGV